MSKFFLKKGEHQVKIPNLENSGYFKIDNSFIPVKLDVNRETAKSLDYHFQRMLKGHVPDLGYERQGIMKFEEI